MKRKFIRDKWGVHEETEQLAFTSSPDANGIQFELTLGGIGGSGPEGMFYNQVLSPDSGEDDGWDVSCHTQIREAMRWATGYSKLAVKLSGILNGRSIASSGVGDWLDKDALISIMHDQITERALHKPIMEVFHCDEPRGDISMSGPVLIPIWISDKGVLAATSYVNEIISWKPRQSSLRRFVYLEDIFEIVRSMDWAKAIEEAV